MGCKCLILTHFHCCESSHPLDLWFCLISKVKISLHSLDRGLDLIHVCQVAGYVVGFYRISSNKDIKERQTESVNFNLFIPSPNINLCNFYGYDSEARAHKEQNT